MKKTRFFIGLSFLVQAISAFFLMVVFLYKNRKNTAGAFMALGCLSGLLGSVMVYRQIRAQMEDSRLARAIDSICEEETQEEVQKPEIPLDDTANEAEFHD